MTSTGRKETLEYNYGTRFAYEGIFGSGFKLSYAFSRVDVDVDDIGDRFNDLERDGYIHNTEVEYDFKLGKTVTLSPGFELSIGDIDGEANAYTGYQFGLGFRKFSKLYQLMLKGETNGRRDYVFLYSNTLEAVGKECFKIIAPKPGENPIGAKFYDLYRDTREELPVSTEIGAWGGQEFVRIIQRHMMRKQKDPNEGPALGRPYDGVENLRPETKALVESMAAWMKPKGK